MKSKRANPAKNRHMQRTNQRRTAIWSAPLLIAALLFVLGYCSQPAFALDGIPVPTEETQLGLTPEPGAETSNPLYTPTPIPSSTADAESTGTPTQSTTPEPTSELEPTATPEPSVTPEPGRTDEFAGAKGKLGIRITTTTPAADSATAVQTALNIDRLSVSDDAEACAQYLALLDGVVSETALQNCQILTLEYQADGAVVPPPQTPASIRISDEDCFSAYAPDSVQVYCLPEGGETFVEAKDLSVDADAGTMDCAAPSCPAVIVLSGEPASETGATPEPTLRPPMYSKGTGSM